jgi:hypothetical protein
MNLLLAEIQEDINWRVSEISNIKTIPHRYNLLETHRKTLILYSVPSLYALWEGYVKNTFQLLTTYLNNLEIQPRSIHINILTHAIENECQLGNERKHFDKKIGLVESALNIYDTSLNIKQGIPTESNVNYKVVNKVLERFNIKFLDCKYEKPLNRLLLFRNKIAHGENSIQVNKQDIDDFSFLTENLMYDILILIEDYIKNESYKNKQLRTSTS